MTKIIRTKTSAEGGITAAEKRQMDAITQEWIGIAMRTDPIDPAKITPAIHALYAAADLPAPRVVIVPSPLVMAFAYGASAAVWHTRGATDSATLSATLSATDSATDSATRSATLSATYSATLSATRSATDSATLSATLSATRSATYSATDSATLSATRGATLSATDSATRSAAAACYDLAGDFGLMCAHRWSITYQGGNMWAGFPSYVAACRDVLGLDLPEFNKWKAWEDCARHGGFRVMHPEFCLVCDFPEILRIDDQNRAHSETGPSHRWRDGWSLYHWHGVSVPTHWIEDRANLDPAEVLSCENVEQRAAGMEIVGWAKALDLLDCKIIDSDPDPDHGDLIELTLPGLNEPGRFLRAYCPRNGLIVEGCPRVSDIDGKPIDTVKAAQAWSFGMAENEFTYPDAVS